MRIHEINDNNEFRYKWDNKLDNIKSINCVISEVELILRATDFIIANNGDVTHYEALHTDLENIVKVTYEKDLDLEQKIIKINNILLPKLKNLIRQLKRNT